jgi:hypothetical protein
MTDQPIPKPARRRAATKAAMTSQAKHPRRATADVPPPEPDSPVIDGSAGATEVEQPTTLPPDTAPAPPAATIPADAVVAPSADAVVAPPAPAAGPMTAPTRGTGSIDRLEVDVLEFERGAIGGVRAGDVAARQAVVGGIAAGQASVEMGLVNGIAARDVTIQQSAVRGVLAQQVHVEQAMVRSIIANRVTTGPTTGILVAVARRIDGEARILFDWRGGLAFGAALGAFLALIALGRRRG